MASTGGLGIAICGAVIVWGGIEKTLAGANADAEHRAQKRITNGVMGLVWMVLARQDRAAEPRRVARWEPSELPGRRRRELRAMRAA